MQDQCIKGSDPVVDQRELFCWDPAEQLTEARHVQTHAAAPCDCKMASENPVRLSITSTKPPLLTQRISLTRLLAEKMQQEVQDKWGCTRSKFGNMAELEIVQFTESCQIIRYMPMRVLHAK